MKLKTSGTIAALLSAVIGITALTPAAFAQDQAATKDRPQFSKRIQADGPARRGPGGGGLFELGCGPNGAERIDVSLVRLGYRVDLSAEQQTLLDDLKTTALAAQADFADACTAARETFTGATEAPSMIDGLNARIAIQTAQLAAWQTVLPKLEAFYDSLSDEQKADLAPRRGPRFGDAENGPRHTFRHFRFGPGFDENGPMQPGQVDPGAPMPAPDQQAPAPGTAG